MNCQEFQEFLPEFAEGSLAPAQKRVADRHLAECSACRQRLDDERVMAHSVSLAFQREVKHLTLPPDFSQRLLASLRETMPPPAAPLSELVAAGWRRYIWPAAMAAGVLCACFWSRSLFREAPLSSPVRASESTASLQSPMTIECQYRVPILTFREDGDQVVDTLSYQTVVTSEIFRPGDCERGSQKKLPRKPL